MARDKMTNKNFKTKIQTFQSLESFDSLQSDCTNVWDVFLQISKLVQSKMSFYPFFTVLQARISILAPPCDCS